MAFSPDIRRAGQASLTATLLVSSRTVTATHSGGTGNIDNNFQEGEDVVVNITDTPSGAAPPGGVWGLALVRDAQDVAGDYAITGDVLDYVALGAGGSLPAQVQLTMPEHGTARLVLTVGDTAANAQDEAAVNGGGTSAEYHHDSDAAANTSEGGLNSVTGSGRVVGGVGRKITVESVVASGATGSSFRYGDSMTVDVTLGPLGATFINPKNIKIALSTDDAGATRPDGVYRPAVSGVAAQESGIKIDTDFGEVLGGTNYYWNIGVNDALGDASTPAGEQADLWSSGTIEGADTTQRAWAQFFVQAIFELDAEANDDITLANTIGDPVTVVRNSTQPRFNVNGLHEEMPIDTWLATYDWRGANELRGWYGHNGRVCKTKHNNDMSQSVWLKTNITVSSATSVDGNSADIRLTATAANATILQAPPTNVNNVGAFVRRVTGVGTIEMTCDGGVNWVDVTADVGGSFDYVAASGDNSTAGVGFRIATSGDEIDVTLVYGGQSNSIGNNNIWIHAPITGSADVTVASVECDQDPTTLVFPEGAGTRYMEYYREDITKTGVGAGKAGWSIGSANNDYAEFRWGNGSSIAFSVLTPAGLQSGLFSTSVATGWNKVAASFGQDFFEGALNGSFVVNSPDTSGDTIATPTSLKLRRLHDGQNSFYQGPIKVFRVYDTNSGLDLEGITAL